MKRIVMIGAALLAVGTLGACSGSGGSSSPDRYSGPDLAAPSAAASSPASAGDAAGGETRASSPTTGKAPVVESVKIRTADLTVDIAHARDVSAKADAADGIAERAGGEVDGDERTSGKDATATVTLRVPPATLQSTLHALSALGVTRARHLSSRDVTAQVADVTSRASSAQQAIARLRVLYGDASKVADVISIEQELSSREADLESLQAQQRTLANQTQLAAVTLYLRTAAPAATPAKHDRGGFLGGLADGWDAFTDGAGNVAAGAGAALPFVVLVLLVGFALRLAWPRLRPARPAPEPAPSE